MTLARARLARARVNLVRELSNGLAAHIHTLPDDVWRNAAQYGSPCADWKLADVITHLVVGANMLSLSIARALKGQTSPPMGYRGRDGEDATADLVSLRETYNEDLFPEFNASCKRLSNVLVSLDPDAMDAPAFHPAGEMPVTPSTGRRRCRPAPCPSCASGCPTGCRRRSERASRWARR